MDSPVEALRDVSLQVTAGEFVCLVGPSGCGKTTLLRLMDGLLEPDSGQVIIDGDRRAKPGPHRFVPVGPDRGWIWVPRASAP